MQAASRVNPPLLPTSASKDSYLNRTFEKNNANCHLVNRSRRTGHDCDLDGSGVGGRVLLVLVPPPLLVLVLVNVLVLGSSSLRFSGIVAASGGSSSSRYVPGVLAGSHWWRFHCW